MAILICKENLGRCLHGTQSLQSFDKKAKNWEKYL